MHLATGIFLLRVIDVLMQVSFQVVELLSRVVYVGLTRRPVLPGDHL